MPRVLLVKPCCLGDALMATPVLRALAALPQMMIDILVTPWAAPAFDGHPAVHRLLPYPTHPTPLSLVPLARRLVRERYDWGIGLDRSPWVALLLLLSRIPIRAGIAAGWRGLPYTHRVSPTPGLHETELYLAVVETLGVPPRGLQPEYFVSPQLRAVMQQRIADLRRPVVVIHPGGAVNPGSTLLAKRWPAERFAALADLLIQEFAASVILVGGESDHEVTRAVTDSVSQPVVDWTANLSWAELAALLELADLFVGNDSGAGHLAAAVGTPTVSIFGPTSPRLYRPLGPRSIVCAPPASWEMRRARDLRRPQSFSPAFDIRLVTVSEVAGACRRLLEERGYARHT